MGEHVNRLLGRLERALDTERSLAANAAHELRTPLAAVRLRLQTALDQDLSRADVQAALDALATFGHRADKLLQLSRAESSAAFARQSVDLVQLAATVAEEFWSSEPARRRLDLQIAESGVAAGPRRRRLAGDRAAQPGRERAALQRRCPGRRSRCSRPACWWCATTARACPPRTLETLRHRHVRHTRDAAGYGLGLSIVGTIVDKHDGRLELSSPPPGRDHGFEARLTLHPASPAAAEA